MELQIVYLAFLVTARSEIFIVRDKVNEFSDDLDLYNEMRTFFRFHYFLEGISDYCDEYIKEGNVGDYDSD